MTNSSQLIRSDDEVRRFRVHARHIDPHHARLLEEASFEAAAVAYVEDLHATAEAGGEINVVVREVGTSHERCFTIQLESGEAAPCR